MNVNLLCSLEVLGFLCAQTERLVIVWCSTFDVDGLKIDSFSRHRKIIMVNTTVFDLQLGAPRLLPAQRQHLLFAR